MKLTKHKINFFIILAFLFAGLSSFSPTIFSKEKEAGTQAENQTENKNPVVRLQTTAGDIDLELFPDKSPISVKNFLAYVDSEFYNGTVFHRVIKGFMIQGGGFTTGIKKNKKTKGTIKNEAHNGLKNKIGTIAMARLPQPHTASSQFFINTNDNTNLDHRSKSATGWGYAVFGKVIKGMKIVRKIENASTTTIGYYQNVPKTEVLIKKAWVLNKKKDKTEEKKPKK